MLSLTTRYAMRALITLAALGSDEALTSSELASQAGIPSHYLLKIMRQLVVVGLVDSQRGRGGGFRLARRPEAIVLRDVLEATDHDVDSDTCVFGWPECDPNRPCPLHPAWTEFKSMIIVWAEKHTLASVLEQS